MTIAELEQRMRDWISGDYRAIIFEDGGEVVAYALFRENQRRSTFGSFLWCVTDEARGLAIKPSRFFDPMFGQKRKG